MLGIEQTFNKYLVKKMKDSVRAHTLTILPPQLPSNWPNTIKTVGEGGEPLSALENMEE